MDTAFYYYDLTDVIPQKIYLATSSKYNKERLLVELIRKRKQIPFDYYKEIISNYRRISEELDMYKIEDYLSLYKNDVTIADALMREVF